MECWVGERGTRGWREGDWRMASEGEEEEREGEEGEEERWVRCFEEDCERCCE